MDNVFNDGCVVIYNQIKEAQDFTKKSEANVLDEIVKLSFRLENIRDRDNDFINATVSGHKLEKKISIPLFKSMKLSTCIAKISDYFDNDKFYDVIYSDVSFKNDCIYLYLEKAGIKYEIDAE